MKNNLLYIIISLCFLSPGQGKAQEHCMHSSAGSITPPGIMGSHTHSKGSWMLSYQLMYMNMEDNQEGRENLAQENILNQYMMAPADMTMEMHMLGAMYAFTDRFTIMGMVPYMNNKMQMVDRMGMASKMNSSNIGDVSISGLYAVSKGHQHSLQLNMEISIPTGSIEERAPTGHMQHSAGICLPYMMQTGSGTWDLLPAITFAAFHKSFAYGVQGQGRIRTGENSRAYRLGHLGTLNSWISYQQKSWLSFSLRLQALKNWGVNGSDVELDPMMSPVSNALNSGGQQVSSFVGTSFSIKNGIFKGNRLAIEYGVPLYQNLEGIQMQGKSTLLAGWQLAF